MTSKFKKNYFDFRLSIQRPPGGLQLLNLEAYPKNLKTLKIYHIRMILSLITYPLSPKIKPIPTHCLRKCVKTFASLNFKTEN